MSDLTVLPWKPKLISSWQSQPCSCLAARGCLLLVAWGSVLPFVAWCWIKMVQSWVHWFSTWLSPKRQARAVAAQRQSGAFSWPCATWQSCDISCSSRLLCLALSLQGIDVPSKSQSHSIHLFHHLATRIIIKSCPVKGRSNAWRALSAQVFLQDLLYESEGLIMTGCSKSFNSGMVLYGLRTKRMKA